MEGVIDNEKRKWEEEEDGKFLFVFAIFSYSTEPL